METLDYQIKQLSAIDIEAFVQLIQVFEVAFENGNVELPPIAHLEKVLHSDGFLVFAAVVNGTVVGGLTAYTLQQYYRTAPLAYIYDVAIHPTYQRRRIGIKLIETFTEFCRNNGYEEIFVQAIAGDDAVHFYRQTQLNQEQEVVHFSYPLGGS